MRATASAVGRRASSVSGTTRAALAIALAAYGGALRAAEGDGDAGVPGMRLPASVVPEAYDVALTIDPAKDAFSGTIAISVKLAEPADVLWLNATRLALRDISATSDAIKGETIPAAVVAGNDHVVGLRFDKTLPAGPARLSIRYGGAIDSSSAVGVFRQKDGENWYVYSQFEPMYARLAFPCFDEPGQKAGWKLTLTIPEGQRAFANMPIAAERAAGPGLREVTFKRTPPLSSYLVAFAVGPFDVRDAGTAGINKTPVSIVTPKGRTSEAAFAAKETPAILEALERYFGVPYPFPKLDLIAYPKVAVFGAMENPGLVTYAARLILARHEEQTPQFEQAFVAVTAHELAHMWFGNLVTLAWWDDVWLNESFASWLGTKITAELKPAWHWELQLQRTRAWAIATDRLRSARPMHQPVVAPQDVIAAFDAIGYAKGQVLLTMIEAWVGPERFREANRRYIKDHAWSTANAEDYFAAVASTDPAAAQSLRGFVERPGVPLVDFALDCGKGARGVTLRQQRFAPLGAADAASAPWTFPVCASFGDARTAQAPCVTLSEPDARMSVATQACPQWILPNRGGQGYYVSRLQSPMYAALATTGAAGTIADLAALLSDVLVLSQSGAMAYPDALALAARYATHPDPFVSRMAFAVAIEMPRSLVTPANDARYAAWVRSHFGPRARALGWVPKSGETPDTAALRQIALPFVAIQGREVALAHEARVLIDRWSKNPKALPVASRGAVFMTGARTAGRAAPALFETYLAAALKTRDENERRDLLRALGAFEDPALVARAANLALDSRFDSQDAITPLRSALAAPPMRADALAWVDAHTDALIARTPREAQGFWPAWAASACSEGERSFYMRAFATRAPRYDGGAASYNEGLEAVDLCLALRAAQEAAVNRYFAQAR